MRCISIHGSDRNRRIASVNHNRYCGGSCRIIERSCCCETPRAERYVGISQRIAGSTSPELIEGVFDPTLGHIQRLCRLQIVYRSKTGGIDHGEKHYAHEREDDDDKYGGYDRATFLI